LLTQLQSSRNEDHPALRTDLLLIPQNTVRNTQSTMLFPPSIQILLHSSLLLWSAYYLIVKPSIIVDSRIVVIFGEALQLVKTRSKWSLTFSLAPFLSFPLWRSRSFIRRPFIILSRSDRYFTALSKRLDLLSSNRYCFQKLKIDKNSAPLRVVLTFILSAVVYLNSSPNIGNDLAITALFYELWFSFWLFATLRSEAAKTRAARHQA